MKGGQNLRDLQAHKAKQVEEMWVKQPTCMVCNKDCEGYYARYSDTGVCSGECMRVQEAQPRYPGHEAADFERKHNL